MPSTTTFVQNNRLFEGVLFSSLHEYPTFVHARSVFTNKWYNFIVPSVSPEQLDWSQVQNVLASEKKLGYSLSYYVSASLVAGYRQYFAAQGKKNETDSDFYLFGKNQTSTDLVGDLLEVDTPSEEERFLEMDKICFPHWDNNVRYSQYFFDQARNAKNHLIRNFLFQVDGQDVGFCGLLASTELSLAYMHNTGIMPEFRRKGYFSSMIKHLLNFSAEHGIAESFALVDEHGGSYPALKKLGFEVRDRYYLFDAE